MIVTCPECKRVYEDATRWTICPHPYLDDARGKELIKAYQDGKEKGKEPVTNSTRQFTVN